MLKAHKQSELATTTKHSCKRKEETEKRHLSFMGFLTEDGTGRLNTSDSVQMGLETAASG